MSTTVRPSRATAIPPALARNPRAKALPPAEVEANQRAAARKPWTAQDVAHALDSAFFVDAVRDITTADKENSWVVLVATSDGQQFYVTVERNQTIPSVWAS